MPHARTRLSIIAGGALALALSLASTAMAQDRARGATPELPVFRIAGTAAAPAVTTAQLALPGLPAPEPGLRAPRPPARGDDVRTAAMSTLSTGRGGRPATAGAVQAPGPTELQNVTLTAQRPWVNNQANVRYMLPYEVNTATGVVTFNINYPGRTAMVFNAVAGASYLVEFAVDPIGYGTFRVTSGSNVQDFPQTNTNPRRLMVGVQATAAGWISVDLSRPTGSGYHLQEIRITRVP